MKLFADWLLLPVAFFTLVSGLVLSLGTQWGLARHRWVYVKFWLTLATVTATAFALRPGLGSTVSAVAAGEPLPDATGLMMGPIVSLSAYVFMTVISVLKPWGLTRRGRRLRAESARPRSGDIRRGRPAQPARQNSCTRSATPSASTTSTTGPRPASAASS
jgi:hypothetical protein